MMFLIISHRSTKAPIKKNAHGDFLDSIAKNKINREILCLQIAVTKLENTYGNITYEYKNKKANKKTLYCKITYAENLVSNLLETLNHIKILINDIKKCTNMDDAYFRHIRQQKRTLAKTIRAVRERIQLLCINIIKNKSYLH